MFITHDLSVVKHISHEIAVLYLGQCVEQCETKELFRRPLHPYTKALLNAILVPSIEARDKKIEIIQGEIASPINPKAGCRFSARCPYAIDACRKEDIPLVEADHEHFVACLRYKEIN